METKKVFFAEWAYVFATLTLALGTALMERADFGVSMVVAPSYLLHLKISQFFPAYSFGMSEYVFQAALLVLLALLLRKFSLAYLFSFVTALLFGCALDLWIAALSLLPATLFLRAVYYLAGMLVCAMGVSLFFHSYVTPGAYELFVKELAAAHGKDPSRVKTLYDCCSCFTGILLSLLFFGRFEGVKLGTVFCAAVNGRLIGFCSAMLEKRFTFADRLPYRSFFEGKT